MKIALTGKAGAGTVELFNAISGRNPAEHRGSSIATVKVPDKRVDDLAEIWNPRKTIYTEAQFVDASAETAAGDQGLHTISTCEALALVVNDDLPIGDEPPNPLRDINDFAADLVLRDQMVVENRLERLAKQNTKGQERDLLEKILNHVETGAPLRTLELRPEESRGLGGFGFLSAMPLLVVVNVSEDRAQAPLDQAVIDAVEQMGGQTLTLSVSLEAEIAQLDKADQKAFLEELGVSESARDRFLNAAYRLLDLIVFLTMGEDECRSWSVRRGAKAPEAGGKIHSDIERGFIRVEVITHQDFMELKSEAACRKAGKQRVEGKGYLVQDGDILNYRFNV